jgi:site-specific DNA-methyltransferase (adenine-specific)
MASIDNLRNKIISGDWISVLRKLPSNSIDMVITSPPYWGLRDYSVDGQIGIELDYKEYVEKLLVGFDEVRRVLKPTGTCWVNLGDTYNGAKRGNTEARKNPNVVTNSFKKKLQSSIPNKSLIGIPQRFFLGMIDRGWIARNDIIWHKPNVMPRPVKDRFTRDHEYIFLFSKSERYYFEQQFEPHSEEGKRRAMRGRSDKNKWQDPSYQPEGVRPQGLTKAQEYRGYDNMEMEIASGNTLLNPKGRNKRTVWEIDTNPNLDDFYNALPTEIKLQIDDWINSDKAKGTVWEINLKGLKESHFAIFPKELIDVPIKAGCPQKICTACGTPVTSSYKVIDRIDTRPANSIKPESKTHTDDDPNKSLHQSDLSKKRQMLKYGIDEVIKCECNAPFKKGIVLDPFLGSGTSGVVASLNNCDFIGIELNKKYVKIARERIEKARRLIGGRL